MESIDATHAFDALSHPARLEVFRLLVRRGPSGVRPSDIAAALRLKPNTLSVYLAALQAAGLVASQRAGRAVLYRAELRRVGALVDYLVDDCCRGRPDLCSTHLDMTPMSRDGAAREAPFHVLFLCTGNSARSIFAEALLTELGGARFVAHSAGLDPAAGLNPRAVEVLERAGHDVSSLRAKPVSEFQRSDAPRMDFVFTVCDRAANEHCPPWPGQPMTGHWGLPDPVAAQGTEAEKSLAFAQTYAQMRRRIEGFVALPLQSLDRLALQQRLDEIGRHPSFQSRETLT
ncbi:helix-turn-helix domain-containing protein [Dinoroseobacter sp. PD6]|uniref:arsenate reductase/protein-tyrosine-phosphatase family protein n=1 Tax=Dinoroseobacter sp. PD6 TaxID=3028384 RepID=UPI00237BF846|nr:helix-turn-helix domain-containing protein [Dinoroseobacter sp. PD6]MDD9716096.1 helix-turn-helix domain-containing protein [Dinoroseobacter sp. PD6]